MYIKSIMMEFLSLNQTILKSVLTLCTVDSITK